MPSFGILAAALLAPAYLTTRATFTVMVGMVFAISCLGLLVLVGWARQISLAQAGLTGAALYTTYALTWGIGEGHGAPYLLGAAGAVAAVAAVSAVTALVCVRLADAYVVALTLSVQFLLENTVFTSVTFTAGLSEPSIGRPQPFGLDLTRDKHFYYLVLAVLAVLVVCILVVRRLRRCRFGRAMLLSGADAEAAAVSGISPWRYKVAAFAVAGLFAGVAGAISLPLYWAPPGSLQYVSFNSFVYLAVPVLAGFDSIAGTVAVAVVLTVLPGFVLSWRVNAYLLGGIAMLVGVFLGPRGLGGFVSDRLRTWPLPGTAMVTVRQLGRAARPVQPRRAFHAPRALRASAPASGRGRPSRAVRVGARSALVARPSATVTRRTPLEASAWEFGLYQTKLPSPYETYELPRQPAPSRTCAWAPTTTSAPASVSAAAMSRCSPVGQATRSVP